ncbi:MbtH family protein [Spirillospora sp. NBC_01491]|uniref:MbtH family protein n=1 Tax=Spirillospora sp. NBC_01491 TaxID=2976007 RepID=UPI002E2FF304|nr:MbtH family protein [Spirillospora sp. NBC_01491]
MSGWSTPLVSRASIFDDETGTFITVRNHEGRRSIWPAARPLPRGWRPAGFTGPKAACLEWIARSADVPADGPVSTDVPVSADGPVPGGGR